MANVSVLAAVPYKPVDTLQQMLKCAVISTGDFREQTEHTVTKLETGFLSIHNSTKQNTNVFRRTTLYYQL